MSTSYRLGEHHVTDRTFRVPLDHADPTGPHIEVFAREIAAPDGPDRPYLVYFQGGPGHEAARPVSFPEWINRALRDYRVLLLDQRGTGRSTPVGTLPGLDPHAQAGYLTHFRADAIVRDAEFIRQDLGVDRWSVLGQSFGGFCVVTYLSFHPHALREAFITGGLPPLGHTADDVYRATYARVTARNAQLLERYPHLQARVQDIHDRLTRAPLTLPSGDPLTPQRFRQLGQGLGMGSGLERLHFLLDHPYGSPAFLHDVDAEFPYARNPLYAALHEACYADGTATRWAAERTLPADFPPTAFTGEMVYPWMFEDSAALRPLAQAADLLARHVWPRLYDEAALQRNTVPVAALVYAEDMYVERRYSEETAAGIGNLRLWLTNEYQHDGLHADGERVLGRLIRMARTPR